MSLIEHKTVPDYNVCMQVFRYMVHIWEAYEKETERIENFRKLPKEDLEAILQGAPGHVVDVIVDVLKALLLKMNVPVPEMEKLTDKVREKKMDELFANMEKMDIQAERRNTALEKKRADEAEMRANDETRRTGPMRPRNGLTLRKRTA